MFRQLGQAPTQDEMLQMIEAVDADSSGTIDFEEFCLLMLRMQRAEITPEWLNALFVEPDPDEVADAVANGEAPPPPAPTHVALRGSFYLSSPEL